MLAISEFQQARQKGRGGTRSLNCEHICVALCVAFVDSGENIHHAMLWDGDDIFWEREGNWSLAKASLPLQCIRMSSSAFAGEGTLVHLKLTKSGEVRRGEEGAAPTRKMLLE